MLILTRKEGESIFMGDGRVKITVLGINGDKVRIGIDAPKEIAIHREEVFERSKADGTEAIPGDEFKAMKLGNP